MRIAKWLQQSRTAIRLNGDGRFDAEPSPYIRVIQRPFVGRDETKKRFTGADWLNARFSVTAGGDATGSAQRAPLAKMWCATAHILHHILMMEDARRDAAKTRHKTHSSHHILMMEDARRDAAKTRHKTHSSHHILMMEDARRGAAKTRHKTHSSHHILVMEDARRGAAKTRHKTHSSHHILVMEDARRGAAKTRHKTHR